MQNKLKKCKLKGNESFNFREGWLRKGMRCVSDNSKLFTCSDVMEQLGVGSKMVKSIKYWLLATGLCEEKFKGVGKSKELYLTEDYGKVIYEYDPYFDDIFTLFILHYYIVANESFCIVWNIFFNEYEGQNFTRENMLEVCGEYLQKRMEEGAGYSEKSFSDDCASVIRMYLASDEQMDPEDSLQCPLCSLGLLQKNAKAKSYSKIAPSSDLLDKMAVFYVLVKNLVDGKNSVSISELLNAPSNIGKVFNLNRIKVNEYLDQLRAAGYITVNRTAGLDMVYLNSDYKAEDILKEYYEAQVR